MTWLTKSVTAVWAVSFSTLAHGENACLIGASSRCIAGTTIVDLNACSITDADLTDLAACFESIGRSSISQLNLGRNQLETLPSDIFASMASLEALFIQVGELATFPMDVFAGLSSLRALSLNHNKLTTLPAGVFEGLSSLAFVNLNSNADLQCVPTVSSGSALASATAGFCECTPASAVLCEADEVCAPGAVGYTCLQTCTTNADCDTANGEECCLSMNICEASADIDAGACGDPHMTGFRGQKFDFVGKDAGWYSVVSDLPYLHLNMRITSPVPSVPELTYITGISIITMDADGMDRTIVISVADPHSLASSCPVGMSPCLADGALHVVVDGGEVLLAPGEVTLASDVAIAAVNLPGACRSFGFEKYWERKKLELLAQSGRKLRSTNVMQEMSEWVLSDPTATNIVECAEYVDHATAVGGVGLFAQQDEHASFQIMTPRATIRLSHGRLHQLPMRDPTDQFDLPDHLTWQMNLAIDHSDMSLDATGILGETLVPTVDANGAPIMQGMDAIRGVQEEYRVEGPLGVIFTQGQRHE